MASPPFRLEFLLMALALTMAANLSACKPRPAKRVLPEGTVLVLSGLPLSAAEIDAVAERLGTLLPLFSLPHLRRLALTNVFFPLLTARAAGGEAREHALEEALRFHREWVDGAAQGPLPSEEGGTVGPSAGAEGGAVGPSARAEGGAVGPSARAEGTWKTLGLEVWLALVELEPGEWSPIFEVPGAFVVARLAERIPARHPGAEIFRADVVYFPYHLSRGEIDQMVFDQELEILDPAWERIVPGAWKTRMMGAP